MGASMREVVSRATGAFRSPERLRAAGPEIRVPPKQALALSMALHELATNAAKYGALSNGSGHIDIAWQTKPRGGPRAVELIWTEVGGPPVSAPVRKGFGSRLIERHLAGELNGEVGLEFNPEGVICRMTMNLPEQGSVLSAPGSPR
jgi:two-component sensor histidine kinase